jgi:hypothetical protein
MWIANWKWPVEKDIDEQSKMFKDETGIDLETAAHSEIEKKIDDPATTEALAKREQRRLYDMAVYENAKKKREGSAYSKPKFDEFSETAKRKARELMISAASRIGKNLLKKSYLQWLKWWTLSVLALTFPGVNGLENSSGPPATTTGFAVISMGSALAVLAFRGVGRAFQEKLVMLSIIAALASLYPVEGMYMRDHQVGEVVRMVAECSGGRCSHQLAVSADMKAHQNYSVEWKLIDKASARQVGHLVATVKQAGVASLGTYEYSIANHPMNTVWLKCACKNCPRCRDDPVFGVAMSDFNPGYRDGCDHGDTDTSNTLETVWMWPNFMSGKFPRSGTHSGCTNEGQCFMAGHIVPWSQHSVFRVYEMGPENVKMQVSVVMEVDGEVVIDDLMELDGIGSSYPLGDLGNGYLQSSTISGLGRTGRIGCLYANHTAASPDGCVTDVPSYSEKTQFTQYVGEYNGAKTGPISWNWGGGHVNFIDGCDNMQAVWNDRYGWSSKDVLGLGINPEVSAGCKLSVSQIAGTSSVGEITACQDRSSTVCPPDLPNIKIGTYKPPSINSWFDSCTDTIGMRLNLHVEWEATSAVEVVPADQIQWTATGCFGQANQVLLTGRSTSPSGVVLCSSSSSITVESTGVVSGGTVELLATTGIDSGWIMQCEGTASKDQDISIAGAIQRCADYSEGGNGGQDGTGPTEDTWIELGTLLGGLFGTVAAVALIIVVACCCWKTYERGTNKTTFSIESDVKPTAHHDLPDLAQKPVPLKKPEASLSYQGDVFAPS